MKGIIELIIALLLVVIIVYVLTFSSWLWATIRLIQGGIIILLALIALAVFFLGFSDLKP